MFEFITRNDENDINGEEYVVAENLDNAKEILEQQFALDNIDIEWNKTEMHTMDLRTSIKFTYAEKPIRVSDYILQNQREHFVGSTAPEMATVEYMMESKRHSL